MTPPPLQTHSARSPSTRPWASASTSSTGTIAGTRRELPARNWGRFEIYVNCLCSQLAGLSFLWWCCLMRCVFVVVVMVRCSTKLRITYRCSVCYVVIVGVCVIFWGLLLCYVMIIFVLCHNQSYCLLCYASLYYVMLFMLVFSCDMLYHFLLCYFTLCYRMQFIVLCYVIPLFPMLWCALRVILLYFYVTVCCVMLCYVWFLCAIFSW